MATSVRDIVQRAYRKIGVLAIDDNLTGDDAQHGVNLFNDMLHAWETRGVDVSHSDLTIDEPFPLADKYREGTIYLLAERLAPDYTRPANFDADAWFRAIQADYATEVTLTVPAPLTNSPSREDRDGNLPLLN